MNGQLGWELRCSLAALGEVVNAEAPAQPARVAIRSRGCQHLILRTSWDHAPRRSIFARRILGFAATPDPIDAVAGQIGAALRLRTRDVPADGDCQSGAAHGLCNLHLDTRQKGVRGSLKITRTAIDGVLIQESLFFQGERGRFMESWNRVRFDAPAKRRVHSVRHNQSRSARGVSRGLHDQPAPHTFFVPADRCLRWNELPLAITSPDLGWPLRPLPKDTAAPSLADAPVYAGSDPS